MKTIILAMAAATFATAALANPVPVTNTSKNPYKESKIYCNDAIMRPSKGENIACYNHDACYSDPQGRTRGDCDEGYLRDMRSAGLGTSGYLKYKALRSWGKASWERCRDNDKRQAAK
jgi:hypothetical protein